MTALVIFALSGLNSISGAQSKAELRVRVTTTTGAIPAGALVGLLSSNDSVVTEALLGETGLQILRVPAGTYRVRVRRIGFLPFVSQPLSLPRRSEFLVRLDERRIVLNAIVVSTSARCGKLDKASGGLPVLWEEISKALLASQLTSADLQPVGRARVYRKEIDAGGFVLHSDTTYISSRDHKPFGALDPAVLAVRGYVTGNENTGWQYFGLDERVLLSPEFSAMHCFRIVRESDRPGQIGMTFKPIPGRQVPDVKGIL